MLIVATLLQVGFRRSHLLYLVYALAGLLLARSSLGAVQAPHHKYLTPTAWELRASSFVSTAQSEAPKLRLLSKGL